MNYNFDEIVDRKNTSCVKWDLSDVYFKTPDLLPMWVADMDFKTPDFIMNAIKERANHEVLGYTIRPDGYFKAAINWINELHGWKTKKDWYVFSPGIVPAVNMAVLAFTNPGDKIIVQPPVYFPFFKAVTDHNRELVYNQMVLKDGRYFMDFDDLRKKVEEGARMIIISNPQNPGGSAWTPNELRELGEMCIEYNVLVISDEIHSDLVIPPIKHTVMANLSPEIAANCITMMAPSKTFNLAGMASSSVIISDHEKRTIFQEMVDKIHVGMGNIFGMVATEAAYTHGHDWRRQMLAYVSGNLDYMEKFIAEQLPQIKMIRPEATYLVWLDFREFNLDSSALVDFIRKDAGLGLNDGPVFGPGGEGFQRMNVACPRNYVVQAMKQLKNACDALVK